jgi:hypothetical protein
LLESLPSQKSIQPQFQGRNKKSSESEVAYFEMATPVQINRKKIETIVVQNLLLTRITP